MPISAIVVTPNSTIIMKTEEEEEDHHDNNDVEDVGRGRNDDGGVEDKHNAAATAPEQQPPPASTRQQQRQRQAGILSPTGRVLPKPIPLREYPSHYPPFPLPGSVLAGKYFLLERLGRGTFCSIHKCIDLSTGIVLAAKLELSSFANSGVLEGEAMVLRHLHRTLGGPDGGGRPGDAVPVFTDYVRKCWTKVSLAALASYDGAPPPAQPPSAPPAAGGGPGTAAGGAGGTTTTTAPQQGGGPGTAGGGGTNPAADDKEDGTKSSSSGTEMQQVSAILMEYLPGEDMARLRDRYCQANRSQLVAAAAAAAGAAKAKAAASSNTIPSSSSAIAQAASSVMSSSPTRRIRIRDAVYLCADVMLPLLKAMHDTGVIHRDVKPSNCVRVGTTSTERLFKIVDFGLSKSFVVPSSSALADKNLPWYGIWEGSGSSSSGGGGSGAGGTTTPQQHRHDGGGGAGNVKREGKEDGGTSSTSPPAKAEACQRQERSKAEFRGTSMYASLRVHQLYDYCRRDDVWSLLYVFCDLLSGGLPWMDAALARDRELCRRIKERCHGEGNRRAGELVYGPAYHRAFVAAKQSRDRDSFKRKNYEEGEEADAQGEIARELDYLRLPVSRDHEKVGLLMEAFEHVGGLKFGDEPDYDLIGRCIRGFVTIADDEELRQLDGDIPPLDWAMPESPGEQMKRRRRRKRMSKQNKKRRRSRSSSGRLDNDEDGSGAGDNIDDFVDEVEVTLQNLIRARGPAFGDRLVDDVEAGGSGDPELVRQLHMARAEYNGRCADWYVRHRNDVVPSGGTSPPPPASLLRDWLAAAMPLIDDYDGTWDVRRHEKYGIHRRNDDGYRREAYVRTIERILDTARKYGMFMKSNFFAVDDGDVDVGEDEAGQGEKVEKEGDQKTTSSNGGGDSIGVKQEEGSGGGNGVGGGEDKENCNGGGSAFGDNGNTGSLEERRQKRRKQIMDVTWRTIAGLRSAVVREQEKPFAPPPAISFADSGGD